MNIKLSTLSTAAALGLIIGMAPAQAQDSSAGRGRDDAAAGVSAKHLRSGESAREIIGKNVASRDRTKLGELQDLVVDPDGGKIVYALVSSGGVFGFGAETRAVPFAAFKNTYDPDGSLTVDIDQSGWNSSPVLGDDPLASLSNPSFVNSTFEAFDQKPARELRARDSAARPVLMRVSDITGKTVRSGDDEVGEIEDVIVSLDNRRASALLDPNDDYTGSDQKLIIGFDQISLRGDELATTLSREELRRATPSPQDAWAAAPRHPYVWTGYGTIAGTTYAEDAIGTTPDLLGTRPGREVQSDGRPSVAVVSGAIRASQELPEAVRRGISIEEEDGKLVIEGTVDSADTKEQVERVVANAAEGRWNVENRIDVRSASE